MEALRQNPRKGLRAWAVLACVLALAACGKPEFDAGTVDGKKAAIETTNLYLSHGECSKAVEEIEPIYKSANSDNNVRMITASAYACAAHVNLFKLLGEIAENGDALGLNFWGLMSKLFPVDLTDPTDKAVDGSIMAMDALLSAIKPGSVILPSNYINAGGFNPGATVAADRIDDANSYLMFISMAAIGSLENAYGDVDPATHKPNGAGLPWVNPADAAMKIEGCAFASAVLHFVDTVGSVAANMPGGAASALTGVQGALGGILDMGCAQGCALKCGDPVLCTGCPLSLRNRFSCTAELTDANSCAAAGLIDMINMTWSMGGDVP